MHRTAALSFFCVACLVILASATPQAPAYKQPQNTPAPPRREELQRIAQATPAKEQAPKSERLKRLEEMAARLARLEQVVKKRVATMSHKGGDEAPSAAAK